MNPFISFQKIIERKGREKMEFDQAFYDEIGCTPQEFIDAKLRAGSSIDAVEYLYYIIAAEVGVKRNLIVPDFFSYNIPQK